MIPEQETYQQQLARHVRERDEQIRAAEDELGQRRTQVDQLTTRVQSAEAALAATLEAWAAIMRSESYERRAHQSTIVEARRQAARAEQAEARIAALQAAFDGAMEGWRNESRIWATSIAAARALADTLETEEAYGGYADANWEAARRIREVLDGAATSPAPTPATEQITLRTIGYWRPACPDCGRSAHAAWGTCDEVAAFAKRWQQHLDENARQAVAAAPRLSAAFTCDHRNPKKLGARPGDLALVCQCGAVVQPGLRPEARP
ncbi:hypothetical protein [Kitasatospora sp. NPDC047058]|uniref:hypothetical protein n=1 Tax=Kitasatospora sp. NPDC047058 TaxID=3155620 RepID=UPI003400046D